MFCVSSFVFFVSVTERRLLSVVEVSRSHCFMFLVSRY